MDLLRRLLLFIKFCTVDQWTKIDADAQRERVPPVQVRFDWEPLVILVVAAVSLALIQYPGDRATFGRTFANIHGPFGMLWAFAWWTGWRVLGYVVIPVVTIAALPGQRLRDYYVSLRGVGRHLWIYALLFLLVQPLVVVASKSRGFALAYPFYKLANRSAFDLLMWELMYAVQFVALEFFFRGFLLRGLAPRFGSAAIFVMIVPYCMIHFPKPMVETFGAIVAGVVLGTLAMRTRSIAGGVLIHIGIAVTMDLLALQHCPPDGLCPGIP